MPCLCGPGETETGNGKVCELGLHYAYLAWDESEVQTSRIVNIYLYLSPSRPGALDVFTVGHLHATLIRHERRLMFTLHGDALLGPRSVFELKVQPSAHDTHANGLLPGCRSSNDCRCADRRNFYFGCPSPKRFLQYKIRHRLTTRAL